jgi:hypothetical protein
MEGQKALCKMPFQISILSHFMESFFPASKIIERCKMLQVKDAFYRRDSLQNAPLFIDYVLKGKRVL